MAGDADLLAMMAEMVAGDSQQVMADLQSATETADCPRIASIAHQLKGMLSTFETEAPVSGLQDLVESARREDAKEAQRLLLQLQPKLFALIEEIAELQPQVR